MENSQSKMFPTDAEFDKVEDKPTMKWADLPQGIYRIEGQRELSTQYGDALILTLQPSIDSNMSGTVDVWCPNRLVEKLRTKPDTKYIRNNGLKVSQNNKAHKYHSFDLL